ncbi:MAG: SDR family NAD(P)-dependent oxidoreductase, partial [Bacteroidota bacterium]
NFGDESDYLKFTADRENKDKTIPIEAISIADEPAELEIAASNSDEAIPAFLPLDQLIAAKESLENHEEEEIVAQPLDEEISTKETTSLSSDIPEIVQSSDDPEGQQIETTTESKDLREEQMEQTEEEISLRQIAVTEERPLTETELLALELAEQLPNASEQNELMAEQEEVEEMISLDDLLGAEFNQNFADNSVAKSNESDNSTEQKQDHGAKIELITEESSEQATNSSTPDLIHKDSATDIDEEDELEGYFVDEGEELEEWEEELSEIEVLEDSNTLVQSGKVDEGLRLLSETLEEAPDFVSVRYQYAAFLVKYKNDFKTASDQLALLLDEEPNNQSALFFLGELAEADRDYLTAKSYYEKVYQYNAEFPNVAYKLGMLLVHHLSENKELAKNYLTAAYQQNPENINALYQLGLLKSENSEEQVQAIRAFEEVLEKAPEHPFANYDLALIYHKKEESTTALKYYELAAQINPELKTVVNDQAFSLELAASTVEQEESSTISNEEAIMEKALPVERLSAEVMEEYAGADDEGLMKEIAIPQPLEKSKTNTKIALITGATSGVGKAIASRLAQEGYRLILTGRRFSKLFQLKAQFEESYTTSVKLLPFDIKQVAAVKKGLSELEEDWRNVDVLINNAGLAKGETPIHQGNISDWEAMIDTNIKGLLYVTREIAPNMVQRRMGQIINISSLAGKEVYPNNGVYSATKHAVDALTKAMRMDLQKYNIRVSQISPGFVEDAASTAVKTVKSNTKTGDLPSLDASDVADIIHFVVTRPKYLNLQEIVITGTR